MNGTYAIQVTAPGKYEVRVEMAAFAPGTQEVVLENAPARADLELTLQSRSQTPAGQVAAGQASGKQNSGSQASQPASATQQAANGNQPSPGGRANRGFQSLAVMQGMAGDDTGNGARDQIVPSGMPIPGVASDAATESVSVSGSGSGVGMFGLSTDELDQRILE